MALPESPAKRFTLTAATTSWGSNNFTVATSQFRVGAAKRTRTLTCAPLLVGNGKSVDRHFMPKLTIAIDGPAGSGKSSVARRIAGVLEYTYLDSGAMYRALALKALQHGVSLNDDTRLEKLAANTHVELKPPSPEQERAGSKNDVFLDGADVTDA